MKEPHCSSKRHSVHKCALPEELTKRYAAAIAAAPAVLPLPLPTEHTTEGVWRRLPLPKGATLPLPGLMEDRVAFMLPAETERNGTEVQQGGRSIEILQ